MQLSTLLFAVLACAAGLAMVLTLATHAFAHLALHRRRRRVAHAPDLSILKPLKGCDDGLEANLASLASQRYAGRFEILLAAADPADPALDVAQRVRRRFPEVDIRIVPGSFGPELNPKVANLVALTRAARYEHLLVSDSNVRVGADYLASTAAELADPRVGLVTNLLAGDGERSLGAALENLHLNSFIVSSVATADLAFGHPCVIGKSMLVRRSALEQLGGWAAVGDVLGEDYLLGRAFHRAGHRVVVSPHVVRTVNHHWPVGRFLARHLRWTQMRRWIAPLPFSFEPLLNPVPLVLAAAIAGATTSEPSALEASTWWRLALVCIGAKILSDVRLSIHLRGAAPRGLSPLWIPVKDVLLLGVWIAAWLRQTVEWRGLRMRIGPQSRLTALSPATLDEPNALDDARTVDEAA